MTSGILSKYFKKEHLTSLITRVHAYKQLFVKNISSRVLFKMNEAFIQYANGSETFNFTFRYKNTEFNVDRQFNLSRKATESVQDFLKRIDVNIDKILSKKKKRKGKKNTEISENTQVDNVKEGNIVLYKQNTAVSLDEPCMKILEDPTKLSMVILGVPYTVKFNAPWIISMKLPTSILSGFPIYPSEFESLFTDKTKSTFTWYKRDGTKPDAVWEEIGEGILYTPNSKDIGSKLKLKCLPRNDNLEGPELEVESSQTVEAGPGLCPFETRQSFTQTKLSGDNFRVTSYNILADIYADSDYTREVLFPYCPAYALTIDYRKLLIIKELIGYNSDIICLQEVDKKVYENDLKPSLSSLNYDSVYDTKGELSEGLAIFYDNRRFELLDSHSCVMGESIDNNPIFEKIWINVTNTDARQRFLGRNTSILVVTLRSLDEPSKILVIGNTHLYFHPDADHVRLLQAFYALSSCQITAKAIQEMYPEHNVTLMLCGDFNSTPVDGVYQLITNNYIPENHKDWSSNSEQIIENVSLNHNLSLASACDTPEYTNFTVEFADCLDYIFYETNKLKITQVTPMPSKEELTLHSAIPSVVFPSDHIAICADMKWIT